MNTFVTANKAKERPVVILLVEDNPGDVMLMRRAFKRMKTHYQLTIAPTGEDALKTIGCDDDTCNGPMPDIVLLDVNLPKMSGLEVLKQIKLHPSLRRLPVVMLSSSHAPQDISRSYDLYANGYIVKPSDLDEYTSIVEGVEQFWFGVTSLPTIDKQAQDFARL